MMEILKNKFKKKTKKTVQVTDNNISNSENTIKYKQLEIPKNLTLKKQFEYVKKKVSKCPKCGGWAKLRKRKNYTHGKCSRPIRSKRIECMDCGEARLK